MRWSVNSQAIMANRELVNLSLQEDGIDAGGDLAGAVPMILSITNAPELRAQADRSRRNLKWLLCGLPRLSNSRSPRLFEWACPLDGGRVDIRLMSLHGTWSSSTYRIRPFSARRHPGMDDNGGVRYCGDDSGRCFPGGCPRCCRPCWPGVSGSRFGAKTRKCRFIR